MYTLKQQIEQIIDEAEGNRVEVIVEMEPEEDDILRYLLESSKTIGNRRTTVTARSLIPPKKDIINERRSLQRSSLISAKSLLASSALSVSHSLLKGIGVKTLKPLLESDIVKASIDREAKRSKKSPTEKPKKPPFFWSSNSAVLKLSKKDLSRLPGKVNGIARIFPNRQIRKPPVFKSKILPDIVEDNKAYTWGIAKTGALASWGAYNVKGEKVKVAILDTGIDPNHPDLSGKVAAFAEFDRSGNTITSDLSKAYDSDQHGTHCAGTIVGGNTSGRWIGMAPKAKILAGLVLKNGVGTDAQILAGIEWAINEGADIINMSLGGLSLGPEVLDTYTRSIVNANRYGIPVVVAVGNEGSQITGTPGNDYFAYTVGATDWMDRAAGFSGGRTQIIYESRYISDDQLPVTYSKPEVSAPGVDIYSSIPGNRWETWNGTSMATPHVAGAMALLFSEKGNIRSLDRLQRVEVVQSLLMSTVKELGETGQDHRFGFGRIDVLRAIGFAIDLGYW